MRVVTFTDLLRRQCHLSRLRSISRLPQRHVFALHRFAWRAVDPVVDGHLRRRCGAVRRRHDGGRGVGGACSRAGLQGGGGQLLQQTLSTMHSERASGPRAGLADGVSIVLSVQALHGLLMSTVHSRHAAVIARCTHTDAVRRVSLCLHSRSCGSVPFSSCSPRTSLRIAVHASDDPGDHIGAVDPPRGRGSEQSSGQSAALSR